MFRSIAQHIAEADINLCAEGRAQIAGLYRNGGCCDSLGSSQNAYLLRACDFKSMARHVENSSRPTREREREREYEPVNYKV